MCPACFSSAALVVVTAIPAGGVAAFFLNLLRLRAKSKAIAASRFLVTNP